MSLPDRVDVAVVGGGAAGIGAARTVAAAGGSVLILEAGDRLGGRAHTVDIEGMRLDLGCGWLHSADRNPMVAVAERLGIIVDRSPARWGEQWRALGFPEERQEEAQAAFAAFSERLRTDPPVSDRASDVLAPGCVWNGHLDALSGYINGAALRDVSVADYLAYDDAATDANWRLPGGYGTLFAAAAKRLAVALSTPVIAIDATGRDVVLATGQGPISAGTAIVTVSTPILASGGIRFTPALDDRLHAAAALPLGLADKLFLAADGAQDLDPDTHLIGSPWRAATASYYLRPFGQPVIEAFFAGDCARVLGEAGAAAAAAFAIDELVALLGGGWRRRLRPIAASAWCRAPFIRGAYSHARPGHAGARAVLRAPAADGRILFAGEACSPQDFSTAHGAWATGVAAAERALAGTAVA